MGINLVGYSFSVMFPFFAALTLAQRAWTAFLPSSESSVLERFSTLAFAAFEALGEFSSGERLAARALPPFSPPSLPRATAAGFFFFSFKVEFVGMRER